jgi:C4-dicarboxylate-specific signal transduction histidine kinase
VRREREREALGRTNVRKSGASNMGRDVTEVRQAEHAVQESQRELARISRQTTLAAMTASIAHEIKQQLAAIVASDNAGIGWLSRAKADGKEALTALKGIVDDGLRASEVITNIRAMFRGENHEKCPLNANELVRDVLTLAHGEIERQQASLQVELCDEILRITPSECRSLNLTMNALEAMSSIDTPPDCCQSNPRSVRRMVC